MHALLLESLDFVWQPVRPAFVVSLAYVRVTILLHVPTHSVKLSSGLTSAAGLLQQHHTPWQHTTELLNIKDVFLTPLR